MAVGIIHTSQSAAIRNSKEPKRRIGREKLGNPYIGKTTNQQLEHVDCNAKRSQRVLKKELCGDTA